jgi:hypothetical protein
MRALAGRGAPCRHANRPDLASSSAEAGPRARQNATVSVARLGLGAGGALTGLGGWRDAVSLCRGPSGYTALAAMHGRDGWCGVLFEQGAPGELPIEFETVQFRSFPCPSAGAE